MPLFPQPSREQNKECVTQEDENISDSNARDYSEDHDWNNETDPECYLLFLIIHDTHRSISPSKNEQGENQV